MKEPTLTTLRHFAAGRSFVECASIEQAVSRLGFVQADPLRAPARAQDLILRHRVAGYQAGELERHYPTLPLSEQTVHVYGFLPIEQERLLFPRQPSTHWRSFLTKHGQARAAVLRHMQQVGCAHPRQVEQALGKLSVVNGWGGTSSCTTMMLEVLHQLGLLRVAHREAGRRVYAVAPPRGRPLSAAARAEGLARLLATLYAPMPERSLRQALGAVRGPTSPHPRQGLDRLLTSGELCRHQVEGEAWIWPASESPDMEADDKVRLLAPFDPVVWDRRRFAMLWNWEYRFEAYTPVAKRKLGYYALPLLWRERVIGWANVTADGSKITVEPGYVGRRPADKGFQSALDAEIDRLHHFLGRSRRKPGSRSR